MITLYLEPTSWDLTVDIYGNIAVAENPYQLAQDAASAIKTFVGECWYDTTIGVDYWGSILGEFPPIEYIKAQMVEAALTVEGVIAAQVFISSYNNRKISGQVQITDITGTLTAANF